MKHFFTLVFLVSLVTSCSHKPKIDVEAEKAIILKNANTFSGYVMASDYDGIKDSYTKEAKIFPNNKKILEGEDIKKYWILPEGLTISHHKIFPENITIVKNTAYDYGYYEGVTKNAQGEESSWKGKYVIVWKKEDGNWKMDLDIWNSVRD
ncbi:YybH family protein [Olleya sp. R77988]|uniref:YybH family protein n=1 Tax=Olleya sp. R77988 TaxID=3093875 RepID=UPI0037CA9724